MLNVNPNTTPAAPKTTASASAQPQASVGVTNSSSWFNTPTAVSKAGGSAKFGSIMSHIQEALNNLEPQTKQQLDPQVVGLDKTHPKNQDLFLSVVVGVSRTGDDQFVAAPVVIVDPGTITPSVEVGMDGQQKVVWERTPSDCFDLAFIKKVEAEVSQWVSSKYRLDTAPKIRVLAPSMVSDQFEVNKDSVQEIVHRLILLPISTVLGNEHFAKNPRSLRSMDQGTILQVALQYAGHPAVEKFDGVVHNARFNLSLSAEHKTQNSNPYAQSLNNGAQRAAIGDVLGYTDVVPVDPNVGTPMADNLQPMPKGIRPLAASVVMTSIESARINTLDEQLLLIATTMATFTERNTLFEAMLASSSSKTQASMWSPGGLNVLANITKNPSGFGEVVDTSSSDTKARALYLDKILGNETLFSMIVTRAGVDTAYNQVFVDATKSQKAKAEIVTVADRLFDGQIAAMANGQPIEPMHDRITLVPIGYYIDPEGVKRSLSDINATTLMNIVGPKGEQAVSEVLAAYMNAMYGHESDVVRYQTLLKLYKEILGQSVTHLATGYMVSFNGRFATMMKDALINSGKAPARINGNASVYNQTRFAPVLASGLFANNGFTHQAISHGGAYTRAAYLPTMGF